VAVLLVNPCGVLGQDRWFARDKAQHFGVTAGIAAAGYALASPLSKRTRWRVVVGTGAGIGTAAGKELRDRSVHGRGSWRDFAWGAIGTTSGVLIMRLVDKAIH
jgi:uncharacterized protein YfiM (DUF2279 family)